MLQDRKDVRPKDVQMREWFILCGGDGAGKAPESRGILLRPVKKE